MALPTLREPPSEEAGGFERRSAIGGGLLWIGTVAYGGSTVALLAVLSRHSSKTAFTEVAAVLGLSFVVSLIPSGITLRSAALVADGQPPPAFRPSSALLISGVSLAVSPILAFLLHVAVVAAAIVTIQMVIGIALAIRQGALLGRHRFEALGTNLIIEGAARFLLGAIAGIALGITGLALGLCAGTLLALLLLPEWQSDLTLEDRPRTSLTATSASLALLGLLVQLDVLVAPSVVSRGGATAYDLAAVPSKGVYLALLAVGPLIFPSVRKRPDRRIVLGASGAALACGMACTGVLVLSRHVIASVLGRPPASPLELGLLGLAMALAGVTGIAISAGIARGVKHPWPPLVLGIAIMLACWPLRPGVLTFSLVVLASQALTTILSLTNSMRRTPSMSEQTEPVIELLAEAGDPFAAAQAMAGIPETDTLKLHEDVTPRNSTVAVVIPTFRRPQMLRNLLDSLASGTEIPDEVIVVDNDPESSVDPDDLPSDVKLVDAGFGINVTAARNAGWRASRSDICIFVDDDNVVDPHCIRALAEATRDGRVGVAGPVIYSGDEGVIWCAGVHFSKWTGIARCMSNGEAEPLQASPQWSTDGLPDVYALRRDVLERVGGLDDKSFPLFGEEFDLCARVGALGLDRIVVREARVRHYGNVSEDPGEYMVRGTMLHGTERAHLMARSRVRVHQNHSHGLSRLTTLLVFVPLWGLASAVACLRVKVPLAVRVETIKAIGSGLLEGYRKARVT
jgi:GT2 family glycosyltransferase